MSRLIPARPFGMTSPIFGQQTAQAVDLGGAELHQLLAHLAQRWLDLHEEIKVHGAQLKSSQKPQLPKCSSSSALVSIPPLRC